MKILMVEDERKTREYLRRGLSEEEGIVDAAVTGREGLDLAQTGLYDAIILDVMLRSSTDSACSSSSGTVSARRSSC